MKQCSRCGLTKPLDQFSKDKNRSDGRGSHCRECRAAYYRRHSAGKRAQAGTNTRGPTYPQLHDPEWLRQRYCVEFRSVKEIAEEIGCAESTLNNALNRAQIPRLPLSMRQVFRDRLDSGARA